MPVFVCQMPKCYIFWAYYVSSYPFKWHMHRTCTDPGAWPVCGTNRWFRSANWTWAPGVWKSRNGSKLQRQRTWNSGSAPCSWRFAWHNILDWKNCKKLLSVWNLRLFLFDYFDFKTLFCWNVSWHFMRRDSVVLCSRTRIEVMGICCRKSFEGDATGQWIFSHQEVAAHGLLVVFTRFHESLLSI